MLSWPLRPYAGVPSMANGIEELRRELRARSGNLGARGDRRQGTISVGRDGPQGIPSNGNSFSLTIRALYPYPDQLSVPLPSHVSPRPSGADH
jgi:hypothetical protein